MVTYYPAGELPPECLALLEREYNKLGYPIEIIAGGSVCVLTQDDELLACLSLNPSKPSDHGLFESALVELHEEHTVARIGTFASTQTLTRKQIRELWEGCLVRGREAGYTRVVSLVTPEHARVWSALFGFKKVTGDMHYPKYGGVFSCICTEV